MIRKLLNPKASKDNTLVLLQSQSGCCDGELTECKYTFGEDAAIVVRGIKIQEGDTEVTTLLADIDGGADMITAYGALSTAAQKAAYTEKTVIPALLEAAGYKVGAKGDVIVSADGKSITIIGEAVVNHLVNDSAAELTPDSVDCVAQAICDYSASYAGADPGSFVVSIDGDDYTVAPTGEDSFAYPDDLAVLQARLTAVLGSAVLGVTVIDDEANGEFLITITEPVGTSVVIDGTVTECCDVRKDYTS